MKTLSKSSGIDSITHAVKVHEASMTILNYICKDCPDKLRKIVKYASLLHDIGKLTEGFQLFLNKIKNVVGKDYRHSEIGWAFLYSYLNIDDEEILTYVCDLVYWHHGIFNEMGKYTLGDIMDDNVITENDINIMKNFVIDLLGDNFILNNPRINYNKKTPNFYKHTTDQSDRYNEIRLISGICIVTADRLVSEMEENNDNYDISDILKKYQTQENTASFEICPKDYDNDRLKEQFDIIKLCDKTTIINAPTGKGKTLMGLIFNSLQKNKSKLIWVCPTRSIARSTYHSITEELNSFKQNVKLELFYSSDTIESNYIIEEPFTSDIIVTTIDSFLIPTYNTKHSKRLFTIFNSTVVFDEYHELVGENGLFSSFIITLRTLHMYSKSNVLLISGTPIKINNLVDTINNKIKILPEEYNHYKPIHDKQYKLNVTNGLPTFMNTDSIIYFNSVDNVQRTSIKLKDSFIIHGGFNDYDKNNKIDYLLNNYGKHSDPTQEKPTVVSTNITQSGFDITTKNVFESVLSPFFTIQRTVGKGNRFGNFNEITNLTVFSTSDRSEKRMVEVLFDESLSDKWFDFLLKYNGKIFTANDLYNIYNTFLKENENKFIRYVWKKYGASLEYISNNIYPKEFFEDKKLKNNIKTAGTNKLRSNGTEIFIIVRLYGKTGYTDPISTPIYRSFNDDFNESGIDNHVNKLIKEADKLTKKDDRYDYTWILKKPNIDEFRKKAKRSITPYIVLDRKYHPVYGITKNKILELI